MVTTIQLNENIRDALGKIKQSPRESFEDIIVRLLKIAEEQKRKQEKLMIEGCREMAEENLKITKEFELIEDLDIWEW